jgi:hypothetical protein
MFRFIQIWTHGRHFYIVLEGIHKLVVGCWAWLGCHLEYGTYVAIFHTALSRNANVIITTKKEYSSNQHASAKEKDVCQSSYQL